MTDEPEELTFNTASLPVELASRIRVNLLTGCWEWQGSRTANGYGRVWWQKKNHGAHRLVYTLLVAPIPDGLTLDHVKARGCKSKACCWPAHLEPVTNRENTLRGDSPSARSARKTHCPQGHPYEEGNTYTDSKGARSCKICVRRRTAERERAAKRRITLRIKLNREISKAASRMAGEDGTTVSPWISALIAAEMKRRSALHAEAVHE